MDIFELQQDDLIAIVKSDTILSKQNFSKYTIEEIGERFLPEAIDGSDVNYAVRPTYWDQLKNEFRKLLCTSDKKYDDLRKKLSTTGKKSYTTIVSSIAAAMASQFGVVAGVLTPFCALILVAILNLGKEAYCANAQLYIKLNAA